jgi:glucose-6-phosphate 1-epimerase
MKLTLCLTSKNTGDAPFTVTEGFHPYLLVRERAGVSVRGIDGCAFKDFNEPERGAERVWTGDYAPITDGSKVFMVTKHEHVMLDPGLKRAIALVSRGNGQLIVWNPGPGSAERVEDFGENGWNRFVCVEPATIPPGKPLELAPGEEHKLVMAIQSVPGGANNQETQQT